MIQDLRDMQAAAGATFKSIAETTIPASFGNDAAAIQAACLGVALCDRTHWGCIQVSSADRIRFLHNQSTNNFERLKPGQGCDTVFVTSTARTIDLVTAYVMEEAVLLLVSPGQHQKLMNWMDRFIFFADKVELKDVTDVTATFSLVGPDSRALLERLGAGEVIGQPEASHRQLKLAEIEVQVAVGSGLATEGYTLIVSPENAAALWQMLSEAGAVPLGEQVWEQLRIKQGRPVPGNELTEDYNPLEAGLWQTISFDKGCYIGQETIARLDTYKGVKQQLWGVRLNAIAEPGTVVTVGDEKVGKLTSVTETNEGPFGLVYIRTKAGGEGLKVRVGESDGELVNVPFVKHGR